MFPNHNYSRQFNLPIFNILAAITILVNPCLAQSTQSRTVVTFSDGVSCSTPSGPPTFAALAVSLNGKMPVSSGIGGGGGSGRLTLDDVGITRATDNCSVSIFRLFFKGQRIMQVTISFENLVNGIYKQELKITLAEAILTSISDTGGVNSVGQEKLTLAYSKITIFDPQTGQTVTYDVQRNMTT